MLNSKEKKELVKYAEKILKHAQKFIKDMKIYLRCRFL